MKQYRIYFNNEIQKANYLYDNKLNGLTYFSYPEMKDIREKIIINLLIEPCKCNPLWFYSILKQSEIFDKFVCNSKKFYEFLYLKYVNEELPKNTNHKDLRRIVEDAFEVAEQSDITKAKKENYKTTLKCLKFGIFADSKIDKSQNILNTTFLLNAIIHNNKQEVELLLKYGANVDKIDNGNIPLILACAYSRVDIAQLLIDYGANVTVKDKKGKTPLSYALENNNSQIVYALLATGSITNGLEECLKYNLSYFPLFEKSNTKINFPITDIMIENIKNIKSNPYTSRFDSNHILQYLNTHKIQILTKYEYS